MTSANPESIAVAESDVPEGWVLSALSEVCQINPPKAPIDSLEPNEPVTFVPMPAVDADRGAITTPQERAFSEVRRGYTSFQDDDVIMAKITPCMENGKAAIARGLTNGLGFGSTEFHVFRSHGAVLPEYIYFFIRQESFRRAAEAEMTGSVGQKRVPQIFLENTELPLPPRDEQERIVERVEQLLAWVNAARERLDRVPAILKRFRQAVLAAACSGNLTADWRELRGVVGTTIEFVQIDRGQIPFAIPTCWRWVRLDQCATIERGRFSVRPRNDPRYYGGHVPFVQIGDLPPDGGDIKAFTQTLNEKGLSVSKLFPKGTVLIAIVGATIGNTGVLTFDSCCPDSLVAIRGKSESHSKLIEYYLRLTKMNVRAESYASGGQPNINLQTLRPMLIPYCSPEEMDEIVRRVDGLLTLADTIERRVAMATARAEKLTQAILAKAFRGELVPTEAELARREGRSYEPASALLARIRSERSATIS